MFVGINSAFEFALSDAKEVSDAPTATLYIAKRPDVQVEVITNSWQASPTHNAEAATLMVKRLPGGVVWHPLREHRPATSRERDQPLCAADAFSRFTLSVGAEQAVASQSRCPNTVVVFYFFGCRSDTRKLRISSSLLRGCDRTSSTSNAQASGLASAAC